MRDGWSAEARRLGVSIALVGLCLALSGASLAMKSRSYTLQEKVSLASITAMGRVKALTADHLVVDVDRYLRGSGKVNPLEVDRKSLGPIAADPSVKPGDAVLVFVSREAGKNMFFAMWQGLVHLSEERLWEYEETIVNLVELADAEDGDARTQVLRKMLASSAPLSWEVALETIYFKRVEFDLDPLQLGGPIATLCREQAEPPILAVRLLGQVGSKSEVIPVLLRLVVSQDENVAKVAFSMLERRQSMGMGKDAFFQNSFPKRQELVAEWKLAWGH